MIIDSNVQKAFNISQILGAVRMVAGENSSCPTIILQLYAGWFKSTVNMLSAKKSKTPPEDIEKMRKIYKRQYDIAWQLIEDMLNEFQNSEAKK